MTNFEFLLFISIGYIFSSILTPVMLKFINEVELTAVNYRGHCIPQAGGLIYIVSTILTGLFLQLATGALSLQILYLIIGIVVTALLGLVDDLFGNKSVQGLKGHFKQLLKGKLTTGGLKAIGGGTIALFLAAPFSLNIFEFIINSLLIALSINIINLLDLRPGRAIKGFLAGISIMVLAGDFSAIFWLAFFIGIVLAYFPYDLKAQVMMGDTGSNALGVALGLGLVWSLPLSGKIFGLTALVLIHFYAEFKSISKLIERSAMLSLLDRLGRGQR